MANDYQQTVQHLSLVGMEAASPLLASIGKIATVFPLPPDKNPALPRVVPIHTIAPETQVGPTANWGTGDSNLTPIIIEPKLYVQAFGIPSDELQLGASLDWLIALNAQKFAATISDAYTALLTVDNFGEAIVTKTAGSFGADDFETTFSAVPTADRVVVLDSPYFGKVKPATWLPVGFSNVFEHTRWTAAGTDVRGFAGDRRAIVVSYSEPMTAPIGQQVLARSTMPLPQIGVCAEASLFYVVATRSIRAAFALYFGCAVGDPSALKLLKTA